MVFLSFFPKPLTNLSSLFESSDTISESSPPSSELPQLVLLLSPTAGDGGLTEEDLLLASPEVLVACVPLRFFSVSGGDSTRFV